MIDGRHMPKRTRARQAFLPDETHIAAQRQALPNFDSYDTHQLLADAEVLAKEAGTTGKRMTLDGAVIQARRALQAKQIEELTRAMGLDRHSPNFWHDAFMRLAEIHHNVGRLIHRWASSKKKSKSSLSRMWKQVLFVERVDALRGSGSERETFRLLARMRRVGGEWRLQPEGRNIKDNRAREAALRRAYYRAKRNIASAKDMAAKPPSESLTKLVGLLSLSDFERLLFEIENSRPK